MARLLPVLAVALIALACSPGKLASEDLEARLEAGALVSEPLYAARCGPGVEGWHYICTFRIGSRLGREKAAFRVGRDRIKDSTGVLALDLPIGPAPGTPEGDAWSAFVENANRICSERRTKIVALPSSPGPKGFLVRFVRARRIQNAELLKLQALPPPPGRERAGLFSNLLEGESNLLSATARFHTAVLRGKGEAAHRAAGDIEVNSRKLDKLARSLGLLRCVQTR